MDREQLKRLIKESVDRTISSKLTGDELVVEAFSSDGENVQLNENVILNLAAKGFDKYQFKFLERGDERYIFARGQDGTFKWFHFGGNTMIDKGDAESGKALDEFIQDKIGTGFKIVDKDGGFKRFFKAIGRGLAVVLKVIGGFQILGAMFTIIFLLFAGPAVLGTMGASAGLLATGIGLQALFGISTVGAGWVMGKVSKKQEVPMASI